MDAAAATDRFIRYWSLLEGKRAEKRGWDRAWRNWIVTEFNRTRNFREIQGCREYEAS